eukprot:TRINITY_DN3124_c1_g1_i1.p1 TRINITY_DN3124_c1_g1~~TRINITY_DN3124_c1_g1_i1.p1  ORF type:complete len:260 (+),score=54.08 TRINITY_DN3124_c1_g1_i1:74-781(+)
MGCTGSAASGGAAPEEPGAAFRDGDAAAAAASAAEAQEAVPAVLLPTLLSGVPATAARDAAKSPRLGDEAAAKASAGAAMTQGSSGEGVAEAVAAAGAGVVDAASLSPPARRSYIWEEAASYAASAVPCDEAERPQLRRWPGSGGEKVTTQEGRDQEPESCGWSFRCCAPVLVSSPVVDVAEQPDCSYENSGELEPRWNLFFLPTIPEGVPLWATASTLSSSSGSHGQGLGERGA